MKVTFPKIYPPITPIKSVQINNTKYSMNRILRICFFSRPRIPYNANSLFLRFIKNPFAYMIKINAKIATNTTPN